jgi:imidazolonepropionase-like amidohydrolase
MTANGAKILGVDGKLGTVQRGKLADLVVLEGDLAADPTVIRNTKLVFKDGVGYDPAKLIESVEGRVGVN